VTKHKTLRFRKRTDPAPESLEQYARAYDRLQDERRVAASGSVDALLEATPTDALHELVENPILRTLGAVEYLASIFQRTLASDPRRAKAIAELEVSLAENLSPVAYYDVALIQNRCYAWRDVGMALRVLGRLDESLEAFAAAERELPYHKALLHDLAIVRLSVAMTLQELERFDEARKMLENSRKAFAEYGDEKRLVLAAFSEGVLLQRMRRHREARETYLLLLGSGIPIDLSVEAAMRRAIGFASTELGDYADAEANLLQSIALHRQLGQPIEVVRSQYAFGRLLVRRGDAEKAVVYLRPVRRECLQNALVEEAGLCGLEIVEGMVALGNAAAAEALARKIVDEFTRAGLDKRVIYARGYLKQRHDG
jgi:tetratricopeptide (TPR) repeat protein